ARLRYLFRFAVDRPGFVAAYDDAGPILDHFDQGGVVVVAAALRHGVEPELDDVRTHPHRYVEFARLLQAEEDVFVHGGKLAAVVEAAREDRRREFVHGRTVAAGAGVDRFDQGARVNTGLDCHGGGFEGGGHAGGRDHIVGELRHLTEPGLLAHIEDVTGDRFEQRLHRLECSGRARDHGRQGAGPRSARTAADRRIEYRNAG